MRAPLIRRPALIQFFLSLLLVTLPGMAAADSAAKQHFHIAAGDLIMSLESLEKGSGIELIYDASLLKGVGSQGVEGDLTPHAALAVLLEGTGFILVEGPNGLARIERRPASDTSASRAHPKADTADHLAASSKAPDELKEFVVTGTHIAGEIPVGASLSTYDREDFDRLGSATIDSLARYMLENFSSADSLATLNTNGNVGNLQHGAATNIFGGAGFDLSGLGPGATLTLLDGHRIAPGGLDGSIIDVSLIPLGAIDHFEVLTDGASAIYGSDAIAGVVNIVTRRALEGAETSIRYGQSTEGGAGQFVGSQLLGHAWSSGNVLLDYEYNDSQGLDASERSWIGPEDGPYSLIAENHRQSLFFTGTQSLDNTAFSFIGLYSTREFRMSGLQLSTSGFVPNSETGGGHADLGWAAISLDRDLPFAWHVSGSATYSSMNQWERGEEFPDGLAGNHFNSALLADSGVAGIDVSGSGPVLRLPGGALRLALGGGFRSEGFRGSVPSIEPLPLVSESRTDLNAYGELTFPIFGKYFWFPGARRLELSLAQRIDSYSHFGADSNPKWGWTWEPTPGLIVRGTKATSFRAPLISQLDTPTTSYTTLLPSNTAGGKPTDALVINGGSQYLQTEKSKSFTAGIDWTPIHWSQIRVSMTYFNVSYNDRIQSQIIEAKPLEAQPQLLSLSFLNPSLGQVLPFFQAPGFQQDVAGLGPSGVTAIIDNQLVNAATTVEQGVRLDGRYTYDAGGLGQWELSFSGNYLLVDRTSIEPFLPQATNVTNTIAEPSKFRLRGGVTWQYRNLTADLLLNHTSAYQNTLFNPAQHIASWTTEDLTLKVNITPRESPPWRDLNLVLNIQNLADRRPPFLAIPAGDIAIGRSAVPYDGTNASGVGRYVSLEFRKGWR
jgi:outer membrane receptor protein involved in Fe transport